MVSAIFRRFQDEFVFVLYDVKVVQVVLSIQDQLMVQYDTQSDHTKSNRFHSIELFLVLVFDLQGEKYVIDLDKLEV